ncbi:MAG: carbohydrate binding domain-containing protein [Lachnospiraceae bacterium]|nr:carbohydrate binding domain-containing protein [Lachnospiraceae bacterium]
MKRRVGGLTRAAACGLCAALMVSAAACGQGAGQDGTGTEDAADENGQAAVDAEGAADGSGEAGTDGDGAAGQSGVAGAQAGGITYSVNTDVSGLDDSHRISETLFGLFLEDINYAVDGGMYAEMVKNRSFEYGMEARDAGLHGWEVTNEAVEFSVRDGSADGTALNENNLQYAVVHNTGTSSAKPYEGIRNGGYLEGMAITQGASYDLSFYCKSEDGSVDAVTVSLCNEDGTVYAEQTVEGVTGEWQKFETALTADATENRHVCLAVEIPAGTACFDMISLIPQDTYKGLPIRKDFGEYLEALNPAFLRFPGGCVIEGRDEESIYSWKDSIGGGLSFEINGETTVGDVAVRPQGKSIWQGSKANPYYTTYGLGFYEYFAFCEALGCLPVPVLNAGMTCEIQSPFYQVYSIADEEFKQCVQDALDLVEFCRGGENTKWGAVRIAMGHEAPFELKYIGIGNEQWQSEYHQHYKQFVKAFEEAAAADPGLYGDVRLIVANGTAFDSTEGWAYLAKNPDQITTLVDEHYYQTAEWFLENTHRYDDYSRDVQAKVFLGEYAAKANTLDAALAEAAYMTGLEKNGDVVEMACYAPLFSHEQLNQWVPDLIFYSNDGMFGSVNYYVQQMYGNNAGQYSLETSLTGVPEQTLYESAVDADGDVILKLVNVSEEEQSVHVSLTGREMASFQPEADVTVLAGTDKKAMNSFKEMAVTPRESKMEIGENFEYVAPANSLTVIRLSALRD